MKFSNQEPLNKVLQERVDDLLRGLKPIHWHYESRVKGLESYALKIESGRVDEPSCLEDFFGCTLVVRNATEVPSAEQLISKHFDVLYRRPKSNVQTHKSPEAFPFDDLRLYVKLKPPSTLPRTDLNDLVFEVQIKTFLQHAWGIATHDLVYKNSEVKWSRARIAFQIKAMLEHAELVIEEADRLSQAPLVDKTTREIDELSQIIAMLRDRWTPERLPEDLKRLGENVQKALRALRLSLPRLAEMIDEESADGRGARLLDISPYTAVIQAVANRERRSFEKFLTKQSREKLAVPIDLEVTSGIAWPPSSRNVVLL